MAEAQEINISNQAREFLDSNHQLLINGEWVASKSGDKIAVIDPATEEQISEVDAGNAEDINDAVAAARSALTGEWSKIPSHDRAQILNKLADEIEMNFDVLSELEVLDNGMPMPLAQYSIASHGTCLLYTSPSPRDRTRSRMPSSA